MQNKCRIVIAVFTVAVNCLLVKSDVGLHKTSTHCSGNVGEDCNPVYKGYGDYLIITPKPPTPPADECDDEDCFYGSGSGSGDVPDVSDDIIYATFTPPSVSTTFSTTSTFASRASTTSTTAAPTYIASTIATSTSRASTTSTTAAPTYIASTIAASTSRASTTSTTSAPTSRASTTSTAAPTTISSTPVTDFFWVTSSVGVQWAAAPNRTTTTTTTTTEFNTKPTTSSYSTRYTTPYYSTNRPTTTTEAAYPDESYVDYNISTEYPLYTDETYDFGNVSQTYPEPESEHLLSKKLALIVGFSVGLLITIIVVLSLIVKSRSGKKRSTMV